MSKEALTTIPSLTEDEQRQLATWNATNQDYLQHVCVPQLVAIQAATTPDAVALVAGTQVLSYKEMNQRANQLAHYLRALGVGPNVLVGLNVERSLEMVIGLLAILKAGGAYVPMDPTYPPDRLRGTLEDAQVSVLVTQQSLATHLPTQAAKIVYLDTDTVILAEQKVTDPSFSATASDLAYVIYTSGSTGQPKGVEITHNGLLNLVFWHHHAFMVTPDDRATQVTSPAFDATGWELWPYLTKGASVYLMDEETRATPRLLRDWLISHDITITFLPTALAERVMALEWPATTELRFLLTGADKLYHYPPANLPFALINNYGPTEATVVTTSGRVLPTLHADEPPSIGRPIANMQTYILDEHLRQLPIGTPGELYIGGTGLARGYLNRPELTAQRFLPHPFSKEPGARLYRTGDIARYLPDGQIAFIGRNDQQVKLRGYRIELGEIETILNQHPAVREAAVNAREDVPDEKRLVAYVVTDQQRPMSVSTSELQQFLSTRLPDYMIPTAFVLLDALPLTPNGKVDRAALPAPDASNTVRGAIAAPNTPIEERLTEIVATLLGLDQLGVDDNFFMLGGHSLLGTQIITQVTETFGIQITLHTLFEAPTVQELAGEIEQRILAKLETMSEEEALQMLEPRGSV